MPIGHPSTWPRGMPLSLSGEGRRGAPVGEMIVGTAQDDCPENRTHIQERPIRSTNENPDLLADSRARRLVDQIISCSRKSATAT